MQQEDPRGTLPDLRNAFMQIKQNHANAMAQAAPTNPILLPGSNVAAQRLDRSTHRVQQGRENALKRAIAMRMAQMKQQGARAQMNSDERIALMNNLADMTGAGVDQSGLRVHNVHPLTNTDAANTARAQGKADVASTVAEGAKDMASSRVQQDRKSMAAPLIQALGRGAKLSAATPKETVNAGIDGQAKVAASANDGAPKITHKVPTGTGESQVSGTDPSAVNSARDQIIMGMTDPNLLGHARQHHSMFQDGGTVSADIVKQMQEAAAPDERVVFDQATGQGYIYKNGQPAATFKVQ